MAIKRLANKNTLIISYLIILAALSGACDDKNQPSSTQNNNKKMDGALVKQQFIKANQQLIQKENDEMDSYARNHRMSFVKTGSGVRYFVYKASAAGDSIKAGMKVSMEYTLSLLDGTACYSSANDGIKTFIVAGEEAESGIHKGLQYLKRGDCAILLIPSPLAHGLLGDMNKIPPQMPIVYQVRVF